MNLNINLGARLAVRAFLREAVALVKGHDFYAVQNVLMSLSIEGYIERLLKRLNNSGSAEACLSIAGFRLFSEIDSEGNVTARVGGDQVGNHPEAFLVMTMLLQKHGLLHKERFSDRAPLSQVWLDANWDKMDDWAWYWVREHPELLPRLD